MFAEALDGKRAGFALRLAMLAGTALALSLAAPARAQNATWTLNPGSNDFSTGANWSTGSVPTGTAFFGLSNTTAVAFVTGGTVGGFTFNAGASAYTITISGILTFDGAGIVNNSGQTQTLVNPGVMQFANASSAGSATILNNNVLQFSHNSTAGNATITNNAFLDFYDASTAGNARIVTNAFGTTSFSFSTGPLGDGRLSAGSIAGPGGYVLGANELTVGGNGDSTTVSGIIDGVGGSLVKVGAGTLTLSGTNTYTGGTTINGGKLAISADVNLGGPAGGLTFGGGTLLVSGNVTTARTVTLNAGGGTIEVNGGSSLFVSSSGTITGTGGLTKTGAGTLAIQGTSNYSGDTRVEAGRLVGSSSTAFSANSNYTILAGAVLEVSDVPGTFATVGSLSGAGSIEIGSGAYLITGSTNATATFSGTITGNGSFEFTGSGTQVLTGNVNIGGDLSVCSCGTGQLVLRGGSSSVGGDVLLSGGTLALEQGASVAVAGDVFVFGFGGGTALTVSSGATLTSVNGSVFGAGGTASATVTGAGSRWTVSGGLLSVGAFFSTDETSITVADGGVLDLNGGEVQLGSLATLNIGTGGLAGTVNAAGIANGGRIVADFTDTATLAAIVYGPGSLTKRGSGTLILTGSNTYSGGTTLEGGAVSIASEDNLGDVSGALTLNGGVLQVTGTALTGLARDIVFGAAGGGFDIAAVSNTFTVTQSFTGTGSLSKAGAGTLVLTNTHSYTGKTTVSGGTLRAGRAGSFSSASAFAMADGAVLDLAGFSQTIASLAGAGTVLLGSGSLTTGSDDSSTTFSGTITGTGGLTKTGSGSFTLSGTSSYSGATTVDGGKLVVNGSVANTVVTVNSGATLAGSGTVGGIVSGSGATVAPGNSIGTLTVTGNVAFASGSTYQVEVNAAGQGDRIDASGTATLTGGTVQVLAENGNYAAATSYTILTASGGVSGQFATVTSNLAFLTPSLSYASSSVVLTMSRNDTSFGPDGGGTASAYVAATRNQGFVAVAAEALGAGNPVYDALVSGTAAEARAGFDLLSGEAHAQAVAAATAESRLLREAVLGRLRGPLLTAPGGEVAAGFSADLPGRKGAILLPAPRLEPRYAVWGEVVGAQARSDGDGNAASLARRDGGAILGAELKLHDAGASSLRLGVAGGYTQSRFDLDARLSSGKLESGHLALYAGARFGQLRLDGGLGYSWSESEVRRQVQIRGFSDVLRSQRPGSVLQAFAELGYAFAWRGVALEPFAQLALLRVESGSVTEEGGAAALRVFSGEQNLGFATLGLRAEAQILATPFFARGLVGWRQGFGDLTPQAQTAFAAGTVPARVYAARIDREALVAEAGLDWRASPATTLGLAYSAAVGDKTRDHALKGRVEVRF